MNGWMELLLSGGHLNRAVDKTNKQSGSYDDYSNVETVEQKALEIKCRMKTIVVPVWITIIFFYL